MQRDYSHRGIKFQVSVNAMPGRRMRWTFTTATGLTGTGVTHGVDTAFWLGQRAAEVAIDEALDG